MGPVSGLLWLAGAGVAVVGWFAARARRTTTPRCSGALSPSRSSYSLACITRLIPWERVSLGGHALAVVDAAAARRRQPLADRRRRRLHGPGARAADALRRLLLPGPLRLAAGGAGGRDLRVAAGHRPDGPNHLLVARTLAYAVAYAGLVRHDPVPQAPPGRRRAPPAPDGARGPADRPREPARVRRGAQRRARRPARASRSCSPTSTPSSRSTTASATRPATASCASSPPTPRPSSARGDCLARIGGDEFALVAPGAGSDAARRLADALREAGARVDAGGDPVSLTVSHAVYPEDGTDRFTLMRSLDRELHAAKTPAAPPPKPKGARPL